LGTLDLITTFVEVLDASFENVCELDIIFHSDKVHYIVDEIIQGGLVLETNKDEIMTAIKDLHKEDQSLFNNNLIIKKIKILLSKILFDGERTI
jgi:AP-3 complex subunit sigma